MPTDDELSEQFTKQRSELEQLVTLINANHIQFIDDTHCRPLIDDAAQSQATMQQIGVKRITSHDGDVDFVAAWGSSAPEIRAG